MKIIILGRPNTGKSTLFNVLTNSKDAIVFNSPNVTRDIIEGQIYNTHHTIFDTAGLTKEKEFIDYTNKTLSLIDKSDIILFIVDGTTSITNEDLIWSRLIKKYKKRNVLLLVNKSESSNKLKDIYEYYKLGFGEPILISSAHKKGIDKIYEYINKIDKNETNKKNEELKYLNISIIGQPNVGKSTFVNYILKEKRQIVKNEPGITRDTIKIKTKFNDRNIIIMDTAGLRKKSNVNDDIETLSALKAINSINESNIVILIVDSSHDIEKQTLNIAEKVYEKGKILCIALNKWDLIEESIKEKKLLYLKHQFKNSFHQIINPLILPISAEKGTGVKNLFKRVYELWDISQKKIPTSLLNKYLTLLIEKRSPPISKLKRPMKIKFAHQIHTNPIKIRINVGGASDIPENYKRYIKNGIGKALQITNIPFYIEYYKTENPYNN